MTAKKQNFLQRLQGKLFKVEENQNTWEKQTFSDVRRFGGKIVTMKMARVK